VHFFLFDNEKGALIADHLDITLASGVSSTYVGLSLQVDGYGLLDRSATKMVLRSSSCKWKLRQGSIRMKPEKLEGGEPLAGPSFALVQATLFQFAEHCFQGVRPATESGLADRRWLVKELEVIPELTSAQVAQWPAARQMALFTLLQFSVMILEDMQRRDAVFAFAPDELRYCSRERLSQPLLGNLATFQSTLLSP
jgi:hypothetical protein